MQLAQQRGARAIFIAISLAIVAGLIAAFGSAALHINMKATIHPERAEREELMAWLARLLVLLGVLWIIIGAIAARTRLVRRPGAAAARATWLAFSRPWRARESMLGLLPFDRWLMVIVPSGMLIATHLVISSVLSVMPALLSSAGWFVFSLAVIVQMRQRSPWPLIAAVAGTAMAWCVVLLAGAALMGPGTWWIVMWTTPWLRFIVVTIVLAVLAWAFVAAGGAVSAQVGSAKATGVVVAAFGLTVAVLSVVLAIVGPKWFGEQVMDDTVTVIVAPWAAHVMAIAGGILIIVGIVTSAVADRKPRADQRR